MRNSSQRITISVATILMIVASMFTAGCKMGSGSNSDEWVASPGVTITPTIYEDGGKKYLQVMYENFGVDTLERIKYELIGIKGEKRDTTVKEITLKKLMRPKDRHVVPRAIGQDPVDFDEVHTGKVWVIKD
jgi:hypothetical protein